MFVATIILVSLFILLFAHIIILPLSKKRPVLIKDFEGTLLLTVSFAIIASLLHPISYLFAILLGLAFFLSNTWFIFGVTKENIESALKNAIDASRSTKQLDNDNRFIVDDSLTIKISQLKEKISVIKYNRVDSKRAKLIKNIFRKFIENYSI